MAIRVKLDHLLLDRRLTLTDLADRIGITIANLSVLKTNKARAIRFSTLEALCRELEVPTGRAAGVDARRSGRFFRLSRDSRLQSGLEKPPRVRRLAARHVLGRARHDDLSARVPAFRA